MGAVVILVVGWYLVAFCMSHSDLFQFFPAFHFPHAMHSLSSFHCLPPSLCDQSLSSHSQWIVVGSHFPLYSGRFEEDGAANASLSWYVGDAAEAERGDQPWVSGLLSVYAFAAFPRPTPWKFLSSVRRHNCCDRSQSWRPSSGARHQIMQLARARRLTTPATVVSSAAPLGHCRRRLNENGFRVSAA